MTGLCHGPGCREDGATYPLVAPTYPQVAQSGKRGWFHRMRRTR